MSMESIRQPASTEQIEQSKSISIEKGENKASVIFKQLELNAEQPNSPDVRIVVEKQPIYLAEGESYADAAISIDSNADKLKEFEEPLSEIKELSEAERPMALLNLLREHVQYAYPDVMEKLAQNNPELAEWVAANTGLKSQNRNVPLSDFLSKGYGICKQLSVAYLYFAQLVGIQGCFMSSANGVIKNVIKEGNEKLFRSGEVGEPVSGHSWVELRLSDGRWVPVDPTTKLVGDTPEKLKLFTEANYIGFSTGLALSTNTPGLGVEGIPPQFMPGASRTEGTYHLYSKSTRSRFDMSTGDRIPPTNEPFSGVATMEISTERELRGMKLSLVDVKA
jgi:hypothetical protein